MLTILQRHFIICILIFLPFFANSQTQKTNLPTLYITTDGGTPIESKEVYLTGTLKSVNGTTLGAFDGVTEIRGRGNSTWGWPKKPYRIKLSKKTALLGMKATAKSWTLLANYHDKTLMMNALAFKVSKLLDFEYTVDYRFVDVVLNGQYIGNYQLADQVEAGANRVPILETTIPIKDYSQAGYFLEASGFYGEEAEGTKFTTPQNMLMVIKSPDDKDVLNQDPNAHKYIKEFYSKVENVLFSDNYKDPQNGYQKYFDMTSLVNWYITCEITGNSDAFWSIYMYKKAGEDKIYLGPIWDNDRSWGNGSNYSNQKSIMEIAHSTNSAWIRRILNDPNFNKAVAKRYEELYQKGLEESLLKEVDDLKILLEKSQAENFKAWPNELNKPWSDYVQELRTNVQERLKWLRTSFAESAKPFISSQEVTGPIVSDYTIIGSPGTWGNGTFTKEKVFDGDINTFFDAPAANGQWVGLDLKSVKNIRYIKFRPAGGGNRENRMQGGLFQISDNAEFTNPVTIYEMPRDVPVVNKDYYIKSMDTKGISARYIRYLSPDGSYGNIAELAVMEYYTPAFKNTIVPTGSLANLYGTVIGCSGAWTNGTTAATSTIGKAFDGNTNTFFDGAASNGQWLGLDLGSPKKIRYIKFRPRAFYEYRMKGGLFQISNDPFFTNPVNVYEVSGNTVLENKDYYIESVDPNGLSAQYIRYLGPDGSAGNVAEIAVMENYNALFKSTQPTTNLAIGATPSNSNGAYETVGNANNISPTNVPSHDIREWLGLNLGKSRQVHYIKFRPKAGYENRMQGGLFQLSDNSNFSNPVTIYKISDNLENKDYYIQCIDPNGIAANYVRYVGPDGPAGNVAEISVMLDYTPLFTNAETITELITPLNGTVIGVPDAWNNGTSTKEKAFDGDINTFFDASTKNGQWLGLDLGSAKNIRYIKFRPRAYYTNRMQGGLFQISDNIDFTNPVNIYEIPFNVDLESKDYYIGSINTNGITARYIRYLGPDGSNANVAEIAILESKTPLFKSTQTTTGTMTNLTGTIIGTPNSWDGTATKEKGFDGDNNTFFDGSEPSKQWLGLDLKSTKNIRYIKFRPAAGRENRMQGGLFQVSNNIDFTNPVTIYSIPIGIPLENKDYYIESINPNGISGQYVRYLAPDDSYGNVAEIAVIESYIFKSVQSTTGTIKAVVPILLRNSGGILNEGDFDDPYSGGATTSTNDSQEWLGVDLRSIRNVRAIKFRPYVNSQNTRGGFFQTSDNINFKNPVTIYQLPDNIALENKDYYIESIDPNGVGARYVRYLSPDKSVGCVAEITVLENYNPIFKSTQATTGTIVNLTGNVIGSMGSWNNSTSTKDKGFDGNINTYFDAPRANGQWLGLDLGSTKKIRYIKFRPAAGRENRMQGGLFQVSDDFYFVNPVTLYEIPRNVGLENKDYYIESLDTNGRSARYVRYVGADGSYGNVADLQFYGISTSTSRMSNTPNADNLLNESEPIVTEGTYAYPNPTDSELHVSGLLAPITQAVAVNQSGVYTNLKILNKNTVDVSNLTSGLYIIIVNNSNNFKIYKN